MKSRAPMLIISLVVNYHINSTDTQNDILSKVASFNNVSASYYDHIQSAATDKQYRENLLYKLHLVRTELIHIANNEHAVKMVEEIKDFVLKPLDLQKIREGKFSIDENRKAYNHQGQLITLTVIGIGAERVCSTCEFKTSY